MTISFVETAEPHFALPLPLSEKENQTDNEQRPSDELVKKTENKIESSISEIEIPHHLNGSLKMSTSSKDSQVKEDSNNKTDVGNSEKEEEERHSLWKWPAKSGKLTKVGKH